MAQDDTHLATDASSKYALKDYPLLTTGGPPWEGRAFAVPGVAARSACRVSGLAALAAARGSVGADHAVFLGENSTPGLAAGGVGSSTPRHPRPSEFKTVGGRGSR